MVGINIVPRPGVRVPIFLTRGESQLVFIDDPAVRSQMIKLRYLIILGSEIRIHKSINDGVFFLTWYYLMAALLAPWRR